MSFERKDVPEIFQRFVYDELPTYQAMWFDHRPKELVGDEKTFNRVCYDVCKILCPTGKSKRRKWTMRDLGNELRKKWGRLPAQSQEAIPLVVLNLAYLGSLINRAGEPIGQNISVDTVFKFRMERNALKEGNQLLASLGKLAEVNKNELSEIEQRVNKLMGN